MSTSIQSREKKSAASVLFFFLLLFSVINVCVCVYEFEEGRKREREDKEAMKNSTETAIQQMQNSSFFFFSWVAYLLVLLSFFVTQPTPSLAIFSLCFLTFFLWWWWFGSRIFVYVCVRVTGVSLWLVRSNKKKGVERKANSQKNKTHRCLIFIFTSSVWWSVKHKKAMKKTTETPWRRKRQGMVISKGCDGQVRRAGGIQSHCPSCLSPFLCLSPLLSYPLPLLRGCASACRLCCCCFFFFVFSFVVSHYCLVDASSVSLSFSTTCALVQRVLRCAQNDGVFLLLLFFFFFLLFLK